MYSSALREVRWPPWPSGRDLLLVQEEDPFLTGLELGRVVPADVGAAGEAHDHLLAPPATLLGLVDVDHGLLPHRSVLADSLGGAAAGLRPRLDLGGGRRRCSRAR